jgi:hypothetical protein
VAKAQVMSGVDMAGSLVVPGDQRHELVVRAARLVLVIGLHGSPRTVVASQVVHHEDEAEPELPRATRRGGLVAGRDL